MNIDFEITNGKVKITNENGDKKETEIIHNIEEILITENNIEEIEIKLDELDIDELMKKYEVNIFKIFEKFSFITSLILFITTIIASFFLNNFIIIGIIPIGLTITGIISRKEKNKDLDLLKNKKLQKAILLKRLDIEKKKLNDLKKNSKKIQYPIKVASKKIKTSEMINNLKYKLSIIEGYSINKKLYMNFFEQGILDQKLLENGCSQNSITLIKELIKHDITEKNSKNNFIKKLEYRINNK